MYLNLAALFLLSFLSKCSLHLALYTYFLITPCGTPGLVYFKVLQSCLGRSNLVFDTFSSVDTSDIPSRWDIPSKYCLGQVPWFLETRNLALNLHEHTNTRDTRFACMLQVEMLMPRAACGRRGWPSQTPALPRVCTGPGLLILATPCRRKASSTAPSPC